MEYRKLGRTGLEVSLLGLGTEHLQPTSETMEGVFHAAVDAGVNFVDLLYVEEAYWERWGPLIRSQRDRLIVQAHWGGGPEYELDYCRRTFDHMLAQIGNDHIDVALMTMIDDGGRKSRAWREASLERLRRCREQGRIRAIGGSAHDPAAALEAVESGLIEVLMFPVNMLDHDDAARQALYQACARHEVGLVAMKPYHGGRLFDVNGRPSGITPAQCLSYVFSLPVSTAVPGPKTLAEWQTALHYLDADEDERDYRPVVSHLRDRLEGQCVYCGHCLPCPEGIEIGWVMWQLDQTRSREVAEVKGWYAGWEHKASECVECGLCVERCPFGVDIMGRMRQAVALFETG